MRYRITYSDGITKSYSAKDAKRLPVIRNGWLIEIPSAPEVGDLVIDSAEFGPEEQNVMNKHMDANILHPSAIWQLVSITKVSNVR